MGHDAQTNVKVWLEFTYAQWAKAVKSAQRRNIDTKTFIAQAASEEPLSVKMVAVDWMLVRLRGLALVTPQVGPAREQLNALIEALL